MALAIGLMLCGCVAASANLLINGSFEEPIVSSNLNFTGDFSFLGWSGYSTGDGGNAGIVPGTQFGLTPYDGNQAFSFNGNNPPAGTFIEQEFSTEIGESYTVSCAVGRNNGYPDQILELETDVFGASDDLLSSVISYPP